MKKKNKQRQWGEETVDEAFLVSTVRGGRRDEEQGCATQRLIHRKCRVAGLVRDYLHRLLASSKHSSLVLLALCAVVFGWFLRGVVSLQGGETAGMTDGLVFACFVCAALTVIAGNLLRCRKDAKNLRLRSANVAFRNLDEAVLMTDANARIRAVNHAFTEISGYGEEEILGKNPSIFSSGRHDRSFYRAMWRSIEQNGSWEGEIWNRRKNGDVYPEWLKITSVTDKDGRTTGYVSVFNDLSDIRAKEDRLKQLSYHDQLTRLYNRSAFMALCEHALHRAQNKGIRAALLYINLDRFKRINDSLGHRLGDNLLQQVADRIRKALHEEDEAARLGGDEFIVLLEDLDRETAPARACEILLTRFRQPFYSRNQSIYLTASIGISVFPQDGADLTTLLRNANTAMYLAKHAGRDGYCYYTARMPEETQRFFFMETSLREAISGGQFRLVYQPQISIPDGKVAGLEALLRWQHPVEGLIAPSRFLAAARLAGLMQPLTEWVLHEAARQCRIWREADIPVGRIACNLDAQFFQLSGLEKQLADVVSNAGIHASDLELEILETAMQLHSMDDKIWDRLVTAGFTLAIDDFGTGQSSLSRLKQIPADTLKIDRSFVKDIEWEENDRSIVRTVVAMAKTLGKKSLAEGVETADQLRFLMDVGCDAIQGFYFSRPVPPEEIPALVRLAAANRPEMMPLNEVQLSCQNLPLDAFGVEI